MSARFKDVYKVEGMSAEAIAGVLKSTESEISGLKSRVTTAESKLRELNEGLIEEESDRNKAIDYMVLQEENARVLKDEELEKAINTEKNAREEKDTELEAKLTEHDADIEALKTSGGSVDLSEYAKIEDVDAKGTEIYKSIVSETNFGNTHTANYMPSVEYFTEEYITLNGSTAISSTNKTSDYIPVNGLAGKKITVQANVGGVWTTISYSSFAAYSETYVFINGSYTSNNSEPITIPDSAAYIRIAINKTYVDNAEDRKTMIVINDDGSLLGEHVKNEEIDNIEKSLNSDIQINSDNISEDVITEIKSKMGSTIMSTYTPIPQVIDVDTNSEFKLYFRNILPKDNLKFWIYNNPGNDTKLTTYYYDDHLLIKPTVDGVYTLPWKVFDINSDVIDEGTLTINAQSTVPENISVLVLGDSTVNAGVMTQELLDLYSANNATVTLLGTRGTAPNLHEGRGGWTSEGYCTKEGDAANGTNPFYNNGFDFSYYMTNQEHADLHAVVIQLGINDIFKYRQNNGDKYNSTPALNYFQQIVDSILAYNNTIKIILNLPIPPNSNGTSFTQTYKTNQIYWVYNENIIRFAKELMNHFIDNPNIVISASNCILDTKTDIRDGVHPTDDGYKKLGGRLYQVLKNNVTMPEMDLLNLSGRTLVNSGKTVAATDTHELNDSCVYKSTFSGIRNTQYDTEISYELFSHNAFKVLSNHQDGGRGAGVEFPISNLETGSYKFNYIVNNSYLRCYLLKYNNDTTFNSYVELSSTQGVHEKTITIEDGYIYSIVFTPVKNYTGEGTANVSDISLIRS